MIIQRPTTETNWLYEDREDDRYFTKIVCLPDGSEPWAECTNEEKEAWEEAHKPAEPEQVEDVQDAEVIE